MLLWLGGSHWTVSSWKLPPTGVVSEYDWNTELFKFKWLWRSSPPTSCSKQDQRWNQTSLLRVCPVRFWKPPNLKISWLLWGSVQVLSYRHREKILPLVRSLPCCSLTALLFPSYAPQWRASLSLSNLLSGTGKLVLAPPGALASRLNKPNFLSFCILLYTSVGGLWEVWSTGQNRPCKHDCGKAHLESPQESLLCQDLYSCSPCQKQSSKMLYFNYSYISFLKFFGVLGLVFFNNVRW